MVVILGHLPGAWAEPTSVELAAQKPALNEELEKIKGQRLEFQRELARREEECLKRFFSAPCLEQIREDHLREMRSFDLRREQTLQQLRDIDAQLRSRNRAQRLQDLQNRRSQPPVPDASGPAKGSS